MAAINQSQREDIFNAVKSMYRDIVSDPDKTFHFPSGRSACEYPGYPAEQLDTLPDSAVGLIGVDVVTYVPPAGSVPST